MCSVVRLARQAGYKVYKAAVGQGQGKAMPRLQGIRLLARYVYAAAAAGMLAGRQHSMLLLLQGC